MLNYPNTHAILNTLPLKAQKTVRAWFKRGVPIAVKYLIRFPHLYEAIKSDLADDDSHSQ
jgi:hypothetical protein